MASRIKLPFNKTADSKKINEIEITETLRKEDFSLTEVRILFITLQMIQSILRLFDTGFPIDRVHSLMILYKKFLPLERKLGLLKCRIRLNDKENIPFVFVISIVMVVYLLNVHYNIQVKLKLFN